MYRAPCVWLVSVRSPRAARDMETDSPHGSAPRWCCCFKLGSKSDDSSQEADDASRKIAADLEKMYKEEQVPVRSQTLDRARLESALLSSAPCAQAITKMLVLGTGEAGKSTIFKQMKILYSVAHSAAASEEGVAFTPRHVKRCPTCRQSLSMSCGRIW